MSRKKKQMQTAHLEDWYRVGEYLYGTVTGHPLLPDGEFITTSRIRALDTEGLKALTLNTAYTLGKEITIEDALKTAGL